VGKKLIVVLFALLLAVGSATSPAVAESKNGDRNASKDGVACTQSQSKGSGQSRPTTCSVEIEGAANFYNVFEFFPARNSNFYGDSQWGAAVEGANVDGNDTRVNEWELQPYAAFSALSMTFDGSKLTSLKLKEADGTLISSATYMDYGLDNLLAFTDDGVPSDPTITGGRYFEMKYDGKTYKFILTAPSEQ